MSIRARTAGPWPWIMVSLAGLFPFVSDMSRNFELFTPTQLAWSFAAIVALTTAVAVLAYLLLRLTVPALQQRGWTPGPHFELNVFAMATAVVLALFLYDSNMTELRVAFGLSRWAAGLGVLALFGIYWAVGVGLGPRLVCLLLASLLTVRLAQAGLAVSKTALRGDQLVSQNEVEIYQQVTLTHTPNIYFICLESYHGRRAMAELYGLENTEFLGLLERSGFVVSEGTLANYWYTMASIQSFLQMGHHYAAGAFGNHDSLYARGFVSGSGTFYNPVLNILKRNSYSVVYLLPSDYYYRPGAGLVDVSLLERSWPLAPLKVSLPRFLGREPDTYVKDYKQKVLKSITDWPTGKPAFFFTKLGANHTPSGYDYRTDREEFRRRYKEMIQQANEQIEELCHRIIAHDPRGIIILAGDHGAQSYKVSKGGFQVALREGIPPERLVRDIQDVLLAIRWGEGMAPEAYPFRSLANVMRFVFFRLGGGEALLGTAARDDSYLGGPDGVLYKTAANGHPLATWLPVPRGKP